MADRPTIRFEFAAAGTAPAGKIRVTPTMTYAAPPGYGWTARVNLNGYAEHVEGLSASFRADVADGPYDLTIWAHDPKFDHSGIKYTVNGEALPAVGQPHGPPVSWKVWTQVKGGIFTFSMAQAVAGSNAPVPLSGLDLVPTDKGRPVPATEWEKALAAYAARRLSPGLGYAATMMGFDPAKPDQFGGTFYDATRAFYQAFDETGNPAFEKAAVHCAALYKGYVVPNKGGVQGYWVFSRGLRMHHERTRDETSKAAALMLADGGPFTLPTVPLSYTAGADASREVASSINAMVDAEALDGKRRARLAPMIGQALGHIDEWCDPRPPAPPPPQPTVRQSGGPNNPKDERNWRTASDAVPADFFEPHHAGLWTSGRAGRMASVAVDGPYKPFPYLRPFMVGLTCEALINAWETTKDVRIVPAIEKILSLIWSRCWISGAQAFQYTDIDSKPYDNTGGTESAPDENLLIAPAYHWLYARTGQATWRDRGDAILKGGVAGAWLGAIKQWIQSYRWTPEWESWREMVKPAILGLRVEAPPSAIEGRAFSVKVGFQDAASAPAGPIKAYLSAQGAPSGIAVNVVPEYVALGSGAPIGTFLVTMGAPGNYQLKVTSDSLVQLPPESAITIAEDPELAKPPEIVIEGAKSVTPGVPASYTLRAVGGRLPKPLAISIKGSGLATPETVFFAENDRMKVVSFAHTPPKAIGRTLTAQDAAGKALDTFAVEIPYPVPKTITANLEADLDSAGNPVTWRVKPS